MRFASLLTAYVVAATLRDGSLFMARVVSWPFRVAARGLDHVARYVEGRE